MAKLRIHIRQIGSDEASKHLRDCDYWDKLSPEETKFLSKFNDEFYRNRLPKKAALHRTKKVRLTLYSADNSRRRCIELSDCGQVPYDANFANPMDALIEAVDRIRKEFKKQGGKEWI